MARVLIIEDEVLVAMELCAIVEESGAVVHGPAHTLEMAMGLAQSEDIDYALVDINLGGDRVTPIAAILRERGIPFTFVSAYSRPQLPDGFGEEPLIEKPFSAAIIQKLMKSIMRPAVC